MTADWWNKESPAPRNDMDWLRSEWTPEPEPSISPRPEDGVGETEVDPARKRKLLVSAAWAAMAGIAIFVMMPDSQPSTPQDVAAPQGEYLPPAGNGPAEAPVTETPETSPPKVATLGFSPSGSGRVGAVVRVRISNDTDERLTLIANLVRGDDRPGIVGEGTLAPGAKVIEPGQTVEGTVEFAVGKPPQQVVLVDLSGNVVAAS